MLCCMHRFPCLSPREPRAPAAQLCAFQWLAGNEVSSILVLTVNSPGVATLREFWRCARCQHKRLSFCFHRIVGSWQGLPAAGLGGSSLPVGCFFWLWQWDLCVCSGILSRNNHQENPEQQHFFSQICPSFRKALRTNWA